MQESTLAVHHVGIVAGSGSEGQEVLMIWVADSRFDDQTIGFLACDGVNLGTDVFHLKIPRRR